MKNMVFSKYKRFFAFGCSFTAYDWPTWADIISKEMPQATFYNFGHQGGGNLLISAKMVEANSRFKFNETDLIMVMWTTFCREDRYKNNAWLNVGNIFTQEEYDMAWVKKYADPTGYLIRDLAIISMATSYINSLPCDNILLPSVPFHHQMDVNNSTVRDVLKVYDSFISKTLPSLHELEMKGKWDNGHTYITRDNKVLGDYHPSPARYLGYLQKLGIPLTDLSVKFAEETMVKLLNTKTQEELYSAFSTMLRLSKLKLLF